MVSFKINRKPIGRILGSLILVATLGMGLAVYQRITVQPRTDDAEVFANLIGMAPEVSGPITHIYVSDNQWVKKGTLLFEIDPAPFRYALESAKSQKDTLEGQIRDQRLKIAAEKSAVRSAGAEISASQAAIQSSVAGIEAAKASVATARAAVSRANADYIYARDNLHRLEALLRKQFVTVDQVQLAQTDVRNKEEAVSQARSQLSFSQAQLGAAQAKRSESGAQLAQSHARLEESVNNVSILDPLIEQRQKMVAEIKNAAYYLSRCRIYAPFDARVTNLMVSEGEYAHAGQKVFTLIDTRKWWVIANFRESQVNFTQPGTRAAVYVMSQPNKRYEGVVESVGFGVAPDSNLISNLDDNLPDVRRTLNWVRLASRFPVRVRVLNPSAEDFRIGESALVVMRGEKSAGNLHQ
jgi:multidrug efflux system membrane fusion protein